ncbi:MAG TPA: Ig-like domain-containing protein, partial [Nocardioides sp.]|nr:Ig-like domain-containing protein [Nocardioides sp.]
MNLRTIAAAAATALAAATVAVLGPTPLAHAGPADAPRAYDRYVTTPYGVAWQGNLCTGAWDAQGDKVKVASVAAAPLTAVYDETTCAITLTPYAGASGPFDVTFRLTDGTNLGDPVRLRITVGKDGDLAPVAQPDSFATGKDLKLIIPDMKATLAANDSDPEGHALTVISFSNPENAMLPGESLLGASQFGPNAYLYTPPTGFVGTRRFYYSVTEGSTVTRQLWTVEITDKGVPKTPVTAPDAYVAPKDGVLKVAKPNGVLGNDVDEDSAYMSVGAYTYPSHGTLTIDDTYNGTFTYTPKPGYVGPDEFEYVARDAENHQSGYTKVSLTVKTLAPVAGNDTFKVVRDGTLVIPMADLTANDSDGDSAFSVASTLPAANGTVVADYAAKTVTYTPKPGWTGNDFFGYRLQDPDGNVSNWATVSVGVVAPDVNQAPVSKNDAYSVHQGKSLVVPAAQGPLANDADLEAADIDIDVMGQPAHGDVTVVDKETGAFTYVPDATWNGVDTLTYTAVDPKGAVGAPATISITVVNDAPIAVDDHYTAISGEPLKVAAAAGVLANDTDPEGQ